MNYRTMEYAKKANWILLQPAELLFSQINSFIFNSDKGKNQQVCPFNFNTLNFLSVWLEFDPEFCSKWNTLLELLKVEIPAQMKKAKSKDDTILILCSDYRTCHQLKEVRN